MSASARPGVEGTGEAALAARWGAGLRTRLRLEDGRALRVVFPGVPGGSSGPDFRGAILDAGGDLLRGDVEVHLRASGWRAHGHHTDAAYGSVVLHVVAENDTGALSTLHASGRSIPVLVVGGRGQAAFPPPFTPPCALAVRATAMPSLLPDVLLRLGTRRLRMKAARIAPVVSEVGAGQALYLLLLETLGGSANRAAFATIARELPLAVLCEEAESRPGVDRALTMPALLKGAGARVALRRAGLRPMAAPGARLESAGRLSARLWPGEGDAWPEALSPEQLPRLLRVAGIGRETALELAVNAVLPVALAANAWAEAESIAAFERLPSPGTYGKLRRLEGWLGGAFTGAAALQGGLLLHADYCTKGMCGRCPLS